MNTRTLPAEQPFGDRLAMVREGVRMHSQRAVVNVGALAAGDVLALACALQGAALVRALALAEPLAIGWMWGLLPLYAVGAVVIGLYPGWGLGPVEELRRSTLLLGAVFGVTLAGLFATQQGPEVSRLVLGMAFVLALGLVPLVRVGVKEALITVGSWGVPTVIYGAGETGRRVVQSLKQQPELGFVPSALFDDDASRWHTDIEGVPVLGSTRLVTSEATVAVLALPKAGPEATAALLDGPLACYRTVILMPDLQDTPSLWVRPRDLGGLVSLQITSNLTSRSAQLAKRGFDLAAIALSAPLWVPVCALLTALVWLEDRQSPFYAQERIGREGRRFHALKFRTMVPDAEAALARYLDAHPEARAEWETNFKLSHDPRVTRIGRVLRRLSLDELPQLINVLRGEMSLVGPRPLPAYHHEELSERTGALRTRVRPGLTGLWQVSGRSDLGNEGMEHLDPYYVRNWSVWLDLVVLARTVRAVTRGTGAY